VGGVFAQRDDASTPLALEDLAGLIPSHIAFRRELNEAEQANILRAQEWALARRRDLLTEKYVCDLHRRMLGDVGAGRASSGPASATWVFRIGR
jgi:hypothetical protein